MIDQTPSAVFLLQLLHATTIEDEDTVRVGSRLREQDHWEFDCILNYTVLQLYMFHKYTSLV